MSGDVGMQGTHWNSRGQSDVTLNLSTTKKYTGVNMLLMQCACGVKASTRQYQST